MLLCGKVDRASLIYPQDSLESAKVPPEPTPTMYLSRGDVAVDDILGYLHRERNQFLRNWLYV